MLIDFTVENYRSIKDPVTLSAIAAPQRASRTAKSDSMQSKARRSRIVPDEEIAQTYVLPGADFELLPVLGIFGANASGKSNVLRAMEDFLAFSTDAVRHSGLMLDAFTPFLLDGNTKTRPQRFAIRVLVGESCYSYSFSISTNRISEEKLERLSISSRKRQVLFERTWSHESHNYIWSAEENFLDLFDEVRKKLSSNTLFLGFLFYNFDVPQLETLKAWFYSRVVGPYRYEDRHIKGATAGILTHDDKLRNSVISLLRKFDTGIKEMEFSVHDPKNNIYKVVSVHQVENGVVRWDLDEESRGTQNLLLLATKASLVLASGGILLEDELGSNIHPNITRKIIKLFQSEKTNPKRAQIIFTSHDNTLQRHNLLRRDQVWFTEKREDGSTNLYPLTDFKPRNDLALDQAYLDGRFGAVPILPATEDLLPQPVAESVVAETAG